jgi:methylenetetrahydrofolate dehydrogenase (NADP+)/methenyltetrahydrofolate cyclohydrolase
MIAEIICGKNLAAELYESLKRPLSRLKNTPGLAVIMVGDNHASKIYVENKIKTCNKIGINSFRFNFPSEVSQEELIEKIEELNQDTRVHGILLQFPLPSHINGNAAIQAISPNKDVDGFHPINVGKLSLGLEGMVACTPLGCLHLIKSVMKDFAGKHAVVIGRSNIVGKPMAQLLLNNNCTVTICHSYTKNLVEITKHADILVAAIGREEFIDSSHIKKGALVIDVGINRAAGNKIVGDVNFNDVKNIAGFLTQVPGGVGPMTIAYLMHNTVKAASISENIEFELEFKNSK